MKENQKDYTEDITFDKAQVSQVNKDGFLELPDFNYEQELNSLDRLEKVGITLIVLVGVLLFGVWVF
jgi:hypothetical protein